MNCFSKQPTTQVGLVDGLHGGGVLAPFTDFNDFSVLCALFLEKGFEEQGLIKLILGKCQICQKSAFADVKAIAALDRPDLATGLDGAGGIKRSNTIKNNDWKSVDGMTGFENRP